MSGSENTMDWRERTIAVAEEGQKPSSIGLAMRVAQDLDALAEKIDVQADIVGQLGASFHALAARVAALEAKFVTTSATLPPEAVSPSPPAPLVERMAEVMWNLIHPDNAIPWARAGRTNQEQYRKRARAALRVAAEELLGPVTDEERAALGFGSVATTNRFAAVLRARLARAKEAARG